MTFLEFVKKHSKAVIRCAGAVLLCLSMALFILAFNWDKLPHSDEGDAFDTIFAVSEGSDNSIQ